jgi:hypothetical protein
MPAYAWHTDERIMAESYTTLWANDWISRLIKSRAIDRPWKFLFGGPHISQPSYTRAGVKVGDTIYPIRLHQGVIYILAQVKVKEIISYEEYLKTHLGLITGEEDDVEIYEKTERYRDQHRDHLHLIPRTCTDEAIVAEEECPLRFDLAIPPETLETLRCRSKKRERGIKHIAEGKLRHSISIWGIYRLSEPSAQDLAGLWLTSQVGKQQSFA